MDLHVSQPWLGHIQKGPFVRSKRVTGRFLATVAATGAACRGRTWSCKTCAERCNASASGPAQEAHAVQLVDDV